MTPSPKAAVLLDVNSQRGMSNGRAQCRMPVPIDKKGVGAPGFAEDTDWCRRCGHVETRAMGSPEVELCTEQPQEDVAFNYP